MGVIAPSQVKLVIDKTYKDPENTRIPNAKKLVVQVRYLLRLFCIKSPTSNKAKL